MSGAVSGWLGSAVLHCGLCGLLVLVMFVAQRPFGPTAGGGGGGDGNGGWIEASFGFGAESTDEESGGDSDSESEVVPVRFELPAASREPVDSLARGRTWEAATGAAARRCSVSRTPAPDTST
jgi:hypothetical protein